MAVSDFRVSPLSLTSPPANRTLRLSDELHYNRPFKVVIQSYRSAGKRLTLAPFWPPPN